MKISKPILFKAQMVRAILEGKKTMTRRALKDQPVMRDGALWVNNIWPYADAYELAKVGHCPYGNVGNRLWVRENYRFSSAHDNLKPSQVPVGDAVEYFADTTVKHYLDGKRRPSIFMPRWASRITLEITGVRVERLNIISEKDAIAEGAQPSIYSWPSGTSAAQAMDCNGLHRNGFRNLWEAINGAESWSKNPFVWVVLFKILTGGVKK